MGARDLGHRGGSEHGAADRLRGTSDTSEVKLTVTRVPDRPGIAASLFRGLADRAVNVDMIVQNTSHDGTTDISFTVPKHELAAAIRSPRHSRSLGAESVSIDDKVAQVSVVGAG